MKVPPAIQLYGFVVEIRDFRRNTDPRIQQVFIGAQYLVQQTPFRLTTATVSTIRRRAAVQLFVHGSTTKVALVDWFHRGCMFGFNAVERNNDNYNTTIIKIMII